MAVRTIDGTIEEVELKNRRKLGSVYSRVVFRLPDGRREEVGKSVVWNNVADHLKPGTKGRFYLYSAIDHRGIHGVRTADGAEAYGFGKQNEIVSIVVLVMAALTFWLNYGSAARAYFRRHHLADHPDPADRRRADVSRLPPHAGAGRAPVPRGFRLPALAEPPGAPAFAGDFGVPDRPAIASLAGGEGQRRAAQHGVAQGEARRAFR